MSAEVELPASLAAYRTITLSRWRSMVAWCRRWRPERPADLVDDPRAWHPCGRAWDGSQWVPYQHLLDLTEVCPDCGWVPVESVRVVARYLRVRLGDTDARLWSKALAARLDREAA
jgi:hypothetical protein